MRYYESEYEEVAVGWFQELGYEYLWGPTISPGGEYQEREYQEVILSDRLRATLTRLNPGMSREALEDAYRQISIPQGVGLIVQNEAFHKQLIEGVSVQIRDESGDFRHRSLRVIDFENPENNEWIVINQFTVIEGSYDKRPDIVIFVNGLPLAVFELKNPASGSATIHHAINQIQTYKQTIESLFIYNAILGASDGVAAQVGAITSSEERFMNWRTVDGDALAPKHIPALEVLIKGMFDKRRFLDILKNFILFQHDGQQTTKILAGYHQFHAVNKAVECTKRATSDSGDRRIGVIWHTQGSGKSLSMVFYAGKLIQSEAMQNPTVVVVTDRNDLDDQLYTTFSRSQNFLRGVPVQAESRADLREILNSRTSGGVIFTTIQKFAPEEGTSEMSVLTERTNVVVVADEAHRSQYGLTARVSQSEDAALIKYGQAKYMRDALPNASYIGFTGTPIEFEDKSTPAVFGDYIDVYDLTRAVEDQTTLKIYYENRIAQLNIDDEVMPVLDDEYDEITESEELSTRENLKSKWSQLEKIVGSEARVKSMARDIVEHFEDRQAAQLYEGGKAMIVCMSRRICVDLYNEIVALRPDWDREDLMSGKIKVVMTGSSSDPIEWQRHIGSKGSRDQLAKRMKDKNDELQLVIVRDMWLTGFDVPSLHTMYVDKPMTGHNLMQAIARVNRIFLDKQGGLIVDYIGIAENLKEALNDYSKPDREQAGVDTGLALALAKEKLELIQQMLHKFDYSGFFGKDMAARINALTGCMDHVIGLGEPSKKDYLKLVAELAKSFSLCSTLDEAKVMDHEVAFHRAVKGMLAKIATDDGSKPGHELDAELNQLVSKAIASGEVIDVFASLGLNQPNIALLSDEFLEDVRTMKKKNLAVELLNRLIKGGIRSAARSNLVQSKKFSELLERAMIKYNNRSVETAKVIQELIDLAQEMMDAEKRGEETGLSADEYAFYCAINENGSARLFMEDEIIKQIAKDLTSLIRNSITVDWAIRENVQAKMRFEIMKLLRKYGYPPDKAPAAEAVVMEQARLMCESEVA